MECLESLTKLKYSNFDIFLVDNNSDKDSVDYINNYLKLQNHYSFDVISSRELTNYNKKDNTNLVFILNNVNSGFAGGNNIALKYLMNNDISDYVLLLNNDVIVSDDFLNGLLDKVHQEDNIGFVGSTHYYYDEPSKIQTVGGGIIDWTHGECMAIKERHIYENYDFITGSCVFMHKDVLKEVGLLSMDYFMYWEDVDWSTVARKNNYNLKVSDYGTIYHKEGSSIKSMSRIYYHTANRIIFMKKHTKGVMYYKFLIYIILFVIKEVLFNINDKEYSKTRINGLITGLRAK